MKITRLDALSVLIPQKPPIAPYQSRYRATSAKVALAACMGIRPYEEARAIARQYVEMGFGTLKTKAGRQPEEDLQMVRGIRDGVGDRLKLRIDPNQGYAPAVAFPLARDLEPYH